MSGKRNLAARNSSGTMVTLCYDFDNEQVEVHVQKESGAEDFTLYPPNQLALDVYYHPYAYAGRVLMRGTFAEVTR